MVKLVGVNMVKKKSVIVSKDTWEKLMRLKVDMGKRKIEEVIEWLMEKSKTAEVK
jgi:predicted CopG family antitoxin